VALKLELKPGERVILGDCVITNDDQRTRLTIDGAVPILREKDVMTLSRANSPAKRIYLAVQLMYTSKRPRVRRTITRSIFASCARSSKPRRARGPSLKASIIES